MNKKKIILIITVIAGIFIYLGLVYVPNKKSAKETENSEQISAEKDAKKLKDCRCEGYKLNDEYMVLFKSSDKSMHEIGEKLDENNKRCLEIEKLNKEKYFSATTFSNYTDAYAKALTHELTRKCN